MRVKILIILFLFPLFLNAQGVIWEKSLKEAFKKGKDQNKVVFVEFFSPTCPFCKEISPFFKEKQMGDLYNTHFVNYQLDVSTDEATKFTQDLGLDVYGIPMFLFFRASDSTLVHVREVSKDLASLLQPATMVVNDKFSALHYKERFDKGERSENFLSFYALYERVKGDIEKNREIIDELWKVYPDVKKNSSMSWLIARKFTMDVDNGFVDYWLKRIPEAEAYDSHYKPQDVFARLLNGTLSSKRAESFSAQKWKELREKFTPVFDDNAAFGLIWERETKAYLKEGKTDDAISLGEQAFYNFKGESGSILYLASVFNDNCSNPKCGEESYKWLKSVESLQEDASDKARFYLELAKSTKNAGDLEQAKVNSNEALKNAKTANLDLQPYNIFLKNL